MDKKTVVYRRRPKKKSVADVSTEEALEVPSDDGATNIARCVGSGSDDGAKSVSGGKKTDRKSWVDRSLSNRGRRSSLSSEVAFDVSTMAFKWIDLIPDWASKKGKQGKSGRNGTVKKPSVANRSKRIEPPADFVQEKRAMFAEIDAFELESEEESPISRKAKREIYVQLPELGLKNRHQKLEIVPEAGSEDVSTESLRTPNSITAEDSSRHVRTEVVHGWNLDSDDSVNLDYLASGFRILELGENLHLSTGSHVSTGRQLNSLAEDQEIGEVKDSHGSDGVVESEESLRFGELVLETDQFSIFEALMKECQQRRPSTLREAICSFCDISSVEKLGEGTFGEAFKANGCVFKIVPMDGEILVNGEVQKTSAEIYSEVLLTNTLTRLRGVKSEDSARVSNFCTNFIETKRIYICQGTYEAEFIKAWEDWDAIRSSDNDHPMIFPQKQLYVVFVLADGGIDLESFVLSSFSEARSILLQVVLALGVAEEACGFEHRDLHWGNIVLARDYKSEYGYYRLVNKDIKVKTFGVSVSIIDFTLSRIDTGNQVFFCNLSNDPELFEGPTRDVQSDTYRRMLNLTEGHWEGSFPKTNCFWIHYLADILLNKKSFPISSQEKRALRSFCKRVLLYDSAKAVSSDDFFHDLKVV